MLLQYCNLILPFINSSNGYLQNQSSATRKAVMIRPSYASAAIKEFSPENLLAQLKTCRTNNGAKNITGIRIYAHDTFFQVFG
ncbi:MAG: BLUF domain-containing protein [Methylobacter sp.]